MPDQEDIPALKKCSADMNNKQFQFRFSRISQVNSLQKDQLLTRGHEGKFPGN